MQCLVSLNLEASSVRAFTYEDAFKAWTLRKQRPGLHVIEKRAAPYIPDSDNVVTLFSRVQYVITRQSRRDSTMTLLRELHWLPVRQRVSYKIAELTFKALHVDLSPTYLQQCVQVYTPARSLRSASSYTFVQNKSRTAAGDCTFVHAAATVWNALPVSVTSKGSLLSFKAALKTHFCALAYM